MQSLERLLFAALVAFIPLVSFAHSGGTDRNGCHENHETGGTHCHGSRSAEAYERQMEGLKKSRDQSDAIWFMLGVGAIVFIVNLLEKEYDARNREAWARERALEKEREKERKASFHSPPPRFNYECYAEKNGQQILLCELNAKDWEEAEQKAFERKQMMLRSDKQKYNGVDWSTFTVHAKP